MKRNRLKCIDLILENQRNENVLKLKRMMHTLDEYIPKRESNENVQQFSDRVFKNYFEGRLSMNGMRKAFGLEPIQPTHKI